MNHYLNRHRTHATARKPPTLSDIYVGSSTWGNDPVLNTILARAKREYDTPKRAWNWWVALQIVFVVAGLSVFYTAYIILG